MNKDSRHRRSSSPTEKLPKLTIAIDGLAASGKSTTARLVAQKLGYLYVDSGALYRAVTLLVLRNKVDPNDTKRVARLAEEAQIELANDADAPRVLLNGDDVSREIRTPEVTENIGPIAANWAVRNAMVKIQRRLGANGSVVAEGRDIGTVVFPDADLKFFLVASLAERARRRGTEYAEREIEGHSDRLAGQLEKRDRDDSSRVHGPLKKANDAIELDTSRMSVGEQVEFVLKRVRGYLRQRKEEKAWSRGA